MDDIPASRAGSLTLIGGELALDFANTSSGRGWPTHQEHLRSATDIVDWADHAHVLPPKDAAWMREAASAEPEISDHLFTRALELREDIHSVASEIAAGRAAPSDRIQSLTRTHALCLAKADLAPFDFVGIEQSAPAPALEDRGELPGEIQRIAETGV